MGKRGRDGRCKVWAISQISRRIFRDSHVKKIGLLLLYVVYCLVGYWSSLWLDNLLRYTDWQASSVYLNIGNLYSSVPLVP
ncbi:hypothetical protein H5410_028644 [Solanum commersonii]|uniref:Uncharacterized protein n=1 Tax=Solanum commersonii TaxID=4109 RepID=A0A9J5Z5E4_SOLCO|nr:hypothetical protein H5410_028644 [Solanum commersonii]